MTSETTLLYCYAVARPPASEALAGVEGVNAAEVRMIRYEDLVAVVSPVPSEEFDEAALYRGLEDLDWLEGVARAHNTVVDTLTRATITLPLRLATVYLDEQRVRDVLQQRHDEFAGALDRVAGHLEWGVKIHTVPADRSSAPQAGSSTTSGRSYLRRRLTERHNSEEAWQGANTTARDVDAALAQQATDYRHHRPQSASLSGARGENVLNASYLVPDARTDDFLDLARRFADEADNCTVEVTGPWAPYSFALDPAPPETSQTGSAP